MKTKLRSFSHDPGEYANLQTEEKYLKINNSKQGFVTNFYNLERK